MRLLVHDFAGHPFQIQLSRELATRGHSVVHVYPAGLPGPKGSLVPLAGDPDCLRIRAVALASCFRKYSPVRRMLAHRQYSSDLKRLFAEVRPEVVISGNTPIDIQLSLQRFCRRHRIGFIHWVQDVYCEALGFLLGRRLGRIGQMIGTPFRWVEGSVSRKSDGVIVIADAFRSVLERMGVPISRITVIENWAPLEEVPLVGRENPWRASMRFGDRPVFLYSGTLGLKHRPDLLYKLAAALGLEGEVVVVSEGIGRDYLQQAPRLENLKLVDFQPYERLPEVLGSADVLLATLESDAGQFSVPSKVLAYLCAGRPVLLAAPETNLSSRIIRKAGAGITVDPCDESAWLQAAHMLAADARLRQELGRRARSYAESTFDIRTIASRFERVFKGSLPADQPRLQLKPAVLKSADGAAGRSDFQTIRNSSASYENYDGLQS